MKQFIMLFLSCFFCLFIFSGCAGTAASQQNIAIETDDDTVQVVTTIFPPYDFVREIAGGRVEVKMLLTPGAESHSFEPTPQDIIAIRNCDVFIYVGGESDHWVDNILETVDTSNMKIIALMDLVQPVEEEIVEGMERGHGDEEDGVHTGFENEVELDEHVWTSPQNAQVIVKAIGETLAEVDAGNAEFYNLNTESYVSKLEQLEEAFQLVLKDATRDTVVFGDRFPFRYLADDYGLNYYAAFPGCATETEASAATVAFLITKVREEKIPVVFFIEFSNEKMADIICEATEAKKMLLHSCHNISREDFENGVNYLELMTQNVSHLKEALQ